MTARTKQLSDLSKTRINAILTRATRDEQFRTMLLTQPKSALADQELSEDETWLFSHLQRDEFEARGIDVRPYRSFLRTDGHKC